MTAESPIVDFTDQPFAPGSTPMIQGLILDQFGNPLGGAVITTLTLSIIDTITGATVNAVHDKNILNTDRGTVASGGTFQIQLTPADTALITPGDAQEYRSLILIWKWNTDLLVGMRQYDLLIDALAGT